MTKTTRTPPKVASAPAPTTDDLPIIDKEAPKTVTIGIFNPTVMEMPTLNDVVCLLMVMGFQTAPIAGQDSNGNLVNEQGNVLLPSSLKKFFKLVPVQVHEAPAEVRKPL